MVPIDAGARLYIIEGIPGSGKDYLMAELAKQLDASTHSVYIYEEGDLLFSWRHTYLARIDRMRLQLIASVVRHIRETMKADPEAVFILNRFHISFALLNRTPQLWPHYERLIEQLRQLPVQVLVPVLDPDELTARVLHPARRRREHIFVRYQERRVADSGSDSVAALYAPQQERIVQLLTEQRLPYRLLSQGEFKAA